MSTKIVAPTLIALSLLALGACRNDGDGLAMLTESSGATTDAITAPAFGPFMPTPDPDTFYAQPDPFPDAPPGTILNSREVQFAPLGVPLPNRAWQLQYMATDMHGRPQAAIATVVQPLVPSPTGKALLSVQFAENSPGLKCAPSHQVTGGRENSNSQLEALHYLPDVTAWGWTVIFPDHLGPTSSVGVGRIAAPIVLNGIRAALQFEPLDLSADTPVGLMGYSGGGLATTWSAALQSKLAPELNIVGVAVGGLPANLEVTAKKFDGDPIFFPVMFGALLSINRVFPQLVPLELLNEKGLQMAEKVKDGCLGDTSDGSPSPSGRLADYTWVEDPYNTPGAREVLPLLNLPQPGEAPQAEVYFFHETLDQLAPVAEMEEVAAAWCAAGSRVHVFKSLTGEHVAGAGTGVPSQYLYLSSRFSGQSAVLPPGTESCN